VHSKAESVSLVKLSHVVLGLFEWRDRHCTMELKDNGKKQKKTKTQMCQKQSEKPWSERKEKRVYEGNDLWKRLVLNN